MGTSESRNGNPALHRRRFLKVATALAVAPVLNVGLLARINGRAGSGRQDDWVDAARREIPASVNTSYFQTGGIGPAPTAVIEHVQERLAFQNRGPADPAIAESMASIEPNLRAHLGRSFGAKETEVALTHSTSESISIAVWSRNWQRGDEIILSNQEHPANVIPWYNLRDRFGVVLREIDLHAGTDLIDQVRRQLNSRTAMVSISHVSRNNGRAIPAELSAELGALLQARGVRYHLDGAQGPGCVATHFRTLGADYYSTCGHKWMLGPKGTGAFFVREEILDQTLMSWSGAHSHSTMDYEGNYELLPSAARFEFGTRALATFAGFDRAVTWMEDIGMERILGRINRLVAYAIERTQEYPRLAISSPVSPEERSGVFVVKLPAGCDALDMYNTLRTDAGILASPVKWDRDFRLSIHFFNTTDEIDETLAALNARCID